MPPISNVAYYKERLVTTHLVTDAKSPRAVTINAEGRQRDLDMKVSRLSPQAVWSDMPDAGAATGTTLTKDIHP